MCNTIALIKKNIISEWFLRGPMFCSHYLTRDLFDNSKYVMTLNV